jgi:tetratricopeptide (TPR) repeat protein
VGIGEWLERLEAEAGNLAAAVGWYLAHDPTPLPHLFRVLWLFWSARDHLGEARAWVDQLLPAADALDPQARAELAWTALVTADEVGDDQAVLAARQRLGPLLAGIDDPFLQAVSELAMAWTAPVVGDLDGALWGALASLEQLRGQDEPFWMALALGTAGIMETTVGRHDDAQRHLREARDLGKRFDYAWLAAWSRVLLGTLAVVRGRLEEARALLEEALELSLAAHSTRSVTLCLAAFARLALVEGDAGVRRRRPAHPAGGGGRRPRPARRCHGGRANPCNRLEPPARGLRQGDGDLRMEARLGHSPDRAAARDRGRLADRVRAVPGKARSPHRAGRRDP